MVSKFLIHSLSTTFKVGSYDFYDIISLIQLKKRKYNKAVFLWDKCGIKSCLFKSDNIHHLKKLRRVHLSDMFFARDRKAVVSVCRSNQIPLCFGCYANIHNGEFRLRNLNDNFI